MLIFTPTCTKRYILCVIFALLHDSVTIAGEITQYFPANEPVGNMKTQWRIVWDVEKSDNQSDVLYIKEAFFKRSKTDDEVKVLGDSRLAEIFVAYNYKDRVNHWKRIYDITGNNYMYDYLLTKQDLGPACVKQGIIFDINSGCAANSGSVAVEVHDDSIRYIDVNNGEVKRRGQVLYIWAVLKAANYRYIVRYQFQDDGVVGFRLGATARNMFPSDDALYTHVHMGCWRINVELGDFAKTKYSLVKYDTGNHDLVNEVIAKEGRFKWVADEYTRIRITSTIFNNTHTPPNPISYDLIPHGSGSSRFYGVGEEFTQHDFWLTKPSARQWSPRRLNSYENGEAINKGATLWHNASTLHIPRDEDFGSVGSDIYAGVAITSWVGCDLRPRNFFAKTPLYP